MPQNDNPPSKKAEAQDSIIFTDEDLRELRTPHDDPIVVSLTIVNNDVKWILIDNGSSVDILYLSALKKMDLGVQHLKPTTVELYGFTGDRVLPREWFNSHYLWERDLGKQPSCPTSSR